MTAPIGFATGFELIFEDDFRGVTLDSDLWEYRLTQSIRYRSCQRRAKVSVGDGSLRIAKRKESVDCEGTPKHYTGGGVISKRSWVYGYFEARIMLGTARGWHPAFWTTNMGGPTFARANRSPTSTITAWITEIDLVEHDDWHNDSVYDGQSYTCGIHTEPDVIYPFDPVRVTNADLGREWHIYGAWHTPGAVRFFFNGSPVRTHTYRGDPGVHHLWLSAISLASRTVVDADLPDEMLIDWVRVYREDSSVTGSEAARRRDRRRAR